MSPWDTYAAAALAQLLGQPHWNVEDVAAKAADAADAMMVEHVRRERLTPGTARGDAFVRDLLRDIRKLRDVHDGAVGFVPPALTEAIEALTARLR